MEQYDIQSEQPTAAQEREPEPDTPPPRGRSDTDQDVTSLDAQNFSVDAWLNSRKHLSLEMLLQQQKALRGDVRRFKSDTQTLVHDNYSRFIAAADIIRTMRGEFEGMVGDTDALAAKTQAATGFSEDLSSGLQVRSAIGHRCCMLHPHVSARSVQTAGWPGSVALQSRLANSECR